METAEVVNIENQDINQSRFKRFLNKINTTREYIASKPFLVIIILSVILLAVVALFMFVRTGNHVVPMLRSRALTLAAILLISICVGYSTVIFQTVTGAKILTPGVLGLENIYLFLNAALILGLPFLSVILPAPFAGFVAFIVRPHGNFVISVIIMVLFSVLIFLPLLTKGSKGVYILLLVGIILSTFFSSLTNYMQFLMDPIDFMEFQGRLFASFSSPDPLLMIITAGVAVIAIALAPSSRRLDVIGLGRENAISLGVNYKAVSMRILIIVAVLVSVSTVIVGPVMFLGLIAANLAYQFIRSHKHVFTIPTAVLICAISLLTAEIFIRHVFTISLNVAVVINFFGGIYFIFLLLKNRKKEK